VEDRESDHHKFKPGEMGGRSFCSAAMAKSLRQRVNNNRTSKF